MKIVMARERLATTEAAAAKAATANNSSPKASSQWERLLRSFGGGGHSHRFSRNAIRSHPLSSNFLGGKAKSNLIDAIADASIRLA